MVHQSLDDDGSLQHGGNTEQIVGPLGVVLGNPQASFISVPHVSGLDQIQEDRVIDSTFGHSSSGMLGHG